MNQRIPTIEDLAPLIRSWRLRLAAANLSPRTAQSSTESATRAAGEDVDLDGHVRAVTARIGRKL